MKWEIAKYVSEYDTCLRVKASHLKVACTLQPLPIPSWKWEDISIDFIVGLPNTSRKHDSIWVTDAAKEVLGRHLQDGVQENSKMPSEVLESLQYLTTKSSGACQTRAHETAHMAYILQIRDGTWPTLYTSCNYS
jgi:hypothetical protein